MKQPGCIAFFLIFSMAYASDVKMEVFLESDQIGFSDPLQLQILVTAQGQTSLDPEITFEHEGLDLVDSRISESTSAQFINGHYSSETQLQVTKILLPTEAGEYWIRKIQAKVKGEVLSAQDLKVTVVNQKHVERPKKRSSNPFMQLFSWGLDQDPPIRQRQKKEPVAPTGSDIFIQAETALKKVYKGQQVLVDYFLYHQPQVIGQQIDKFPSFTGFLREDLLLPNNTQGLLPEDVVMKGEHYQRRKLMRVALYPLLEGQLNVDGMSTRYEYIPSDQEETHSLFGLFQQISTQTGASVSPTFAIEVMPLPKEGRPLHFSETVGKIMVSSMTDKVVLKVGEPLKLNIHVKGKASLSNIDLHPFKDLDFEAYEPQMHNGVDQEGNHQKIYQFVALPQTAGNFLIPEIQIPYFDPETGQYAVAKSPAIALKVIQSDKKEALLSSEKKPLVSENQSLQPDPEIMDDTDAWKLRIQVLQIACFFAGLAVIGQMLWYKLKGVRTHPSFVLLKKIKANRTKPLSLETMGVLYECIQQTLEYSFGMKIDGLTRVELQDQLLEHLELFFNKNLDRKAVHLEVLNECLDLLDQMRFSGTSLSTGFDEAIEQKGSQVFKATHDLLMQILKLKSVKEKK